MKRLKEKKTRKRFHKYLDAINRFERNSYVAYTYQTPDGFEWERWVYRGHVAHADFTESYHRKRRNAR